ncbi:amino acid permease 1, NEUTRAL AMINO ACID TRANSPORTER 2 [Hibiscus trionum]|uniref:Amino acid permease 1, NEUTRAL AMINO ACID TRANSPORTER 2 n=1 Tax=Hibiscus trionum TaxID=183268 RepID=A0A9W7M7E8_HIBTR|nr:amino acid permease 1, NEUTRAL AMINO ACID TRANSPORTER 2 [Hibiscus trionum]
MPMELETGKPTISPHLDDDSSNRTGTWVSASAHIITAVIGSGVLSLSWAIAQLGWIGGSIALVIFSVITWFTSALLADCCRDPVSGRRCSCYTDAVKSHLGGMNIKFCGIAQYVNLVGITIGYSITSAISMAAIKRSGCFHKNGHAAGCHVQNNMFIIIFGVIEIVLSQIPNFNELSWLSAVAAVMSFAYSCIGLSLSVAKVAGGAHSRTSLTGTTVGVDVTGWQKTWNCLEALGDIAFAYAFSTVLIEIQDTLKSSPPENESMKKATSVGVSVTTMFYISCGVVGYAAFGNNAPGNFLTGFGFYEPYWLIDIANLCIIIHLVGAYQVFCQPIFKQVEDWCLNRWPNNKLMKESRAIKLPLFGDYNFSTFRFVWRTGFVITTTVVAMVLPFFNGILGLLGAASFWPLTVYFPIQMHISRRNIRPFCWKWIWLNVLVAVCLIISVLAAAGSVAVIAKDLQTYKPFTSVS